MNTMTVTFDKQYKPWLACEPKPTLGRAWAMHVYLDPEGWLVASDTHILAAIPCVIANAPEGFAGCLLPADGLKAAAAGKAFRAASSVTVMIDLHAERMHSLDTVCMLPLQTRFCPWRMVIPAAIGPDDEVTPPSYVAFNPWLLARVALAIGIDKNFPVPLYANDGRSAAVLATPAAIGLIMPGCQEVATDIRPFVRDLTARLSERHSRNQPSAKPKRHPQSIAA